MPAAIAGLLASPTATPSHDGTDLLPRLRAKDFVVVHDTCDFAVEPGRTLHVALPQPVGHVAAWHIGIACFIADAGKSGTIDLGIGSRPPVTAPINRLLTDLRFPVEGSADGEGWSLALRADTAGTIKLARLGAIAGDGSTQSTFG